METAEIVIKLRDLPRHADLEEATLTAMSQIGTLLLVEQLEDYSDYDGAIRIWLCPDGRKLAWFRLSGMEDVIFDSPEHPIEELVPSHFDDFICTDEDDD